MRGPTETIEVIYRQISNPRVEQATRQQALAWLHAALSGLPLTKMEMMKFRRRDRIAAIITLNGALGLYIVTPKIASGVSWLTRHCYEDLCRRFKLPAAKALKALGTGRKNSRRLTETSLLLLR